MAYKFSRGKRGIGDIEFEDDADTGIDFEPDTVKIETGGVERLVVENTVITTTVPIHISGSQTEGLRIAKGNADYREIQFETDGVDTAFIQVDSSEGLVIGCQSDNDEIIFMTKAGGQNLSEKARITSTGRLGIGTDSPDYTLDVAGDVGVNQYIYHNGDANTFINFTDNRIRLNAGGNNFIDCEDNAALKVKINNGGNNIDFVIKDDDNNVYFTADASTAKIGIGTDTPSHKLDVDGDIRVRGNDIRDNSGNPAISFDGSANTEVVNSLLVGGGVYKKVRDVGSTGNVATTDYMIRGVQNNAMVLTLPSKTGNAGQILVIKDMLGNAGSPNNKTITINAATGESIDGSSSYVINTNRGSVTLMCDGINGWMIIGKYSG